MGSVNTFKLLSRALPCRYPTQTGLWQMLLSAARDRHEYTAVACCPVLLLSKTLAGWL